MDHITDHVTKLVHQGTAHYAVQGGQSGVVFHDKGEFIPLTDLALSTDLGFFRRSLFPDEPAIAEYSPYYEVRPLETNDPEPWDAYALVDGTEEFGYLLGEPWQVVEAYHAIKRAYDAIVSEQALGDPIHENSEAMGRGLWLPTSEAAERLHRLDAKEYPLERKTYERLRMAGREGRIRAQNSEIHGWRFHAHSLDEWATDEYAHRRWKTGETSQANGS